jgi:hypothetical protein
MQRSIDRAVMAIVGLVALVALVLQWVLLMRADGSALGLNVRFFSYFTILSNIWVALVGIAVATAAPSLGWFATARVRGAAALYIAVTGSIYITILDGLVSLAGAMYVADRLLHYVVPALYILAWLVTCPHRRLVWSDALRWLVFPLIYVIWTLARGATVHEYPYPFMDVDALGAARVAINSVLVAGLFAVLGLVLVAIDRTMPRTA